MDPLSSAASEIASTVFISLCQLAFSHLTLAFFVASLVFLVAAAALPFCEPSSSDILRLVNQGASLASLNGNMDEIKMWPRALSPTEIALGWNVYEAYVNDLCGYWRMNEVYP